MGRPCHSLPGHARGLASVVYSSYHAQITRLLVCNASLSLSLSPPPSFSHTNLAIATNKPSFGMSREAAELRRGKTRAVVMWP